ncbi:MAG: hypothetical protein RMK20_05875, partial [Verrucomicrobiales bacterium]|nr:hypothetical protein [Verrucomicrobiales bacterium]
MIAGVLAARGEPPPVRGQYRVIDLGRLGGARSEARGINEAGNVAGLSESDTGYQAVRWRWRETNYVIEPLGPGEGYDIANDGTVVGLGDGSGGGTVWPGHGAPMMLGLDKRLNAIAVASGVPVGWVNTTLTNPNPPFNVKFPKHAASFSGSAAADLAQRPEWDCVANGVDSSGSRIVGQNVTNVFLSGVPVQAWLFPNRNLSGLTPYTNSVALAVNTSTQVVGYAYDISTLFQRPMYWSEATGMRLLNVPPTSPYGRAMAINDRGQAVGVLGASAVLWVNLGQPDETNVFLNNLPPLGHGWNLQAAYDINNRGEIVGYGLNPTGYVHGFVLVPTNLLNKIVALRALEVNQAVQDWENSVPLVADKRTLVRAHLELTAPDAQPVLVRGARLLVRRGTATVELAPLNAPEGLLVTTNDAHAVRKDLTQSLNFELPPSWRAGTNVTLQLLWPHGRLVNREPA